MAWRLENDNFSGRPTMCKEVVAFGCVSNNLSLKKVYAYNVHSLMNQPLWQTFRESKEVWRILGVELTNY
jgi:hypothetical protein